MTTVYLDSPYGMTRYVGPNRLPLSYDSLQLFASFTQGGTIPFVIRYSYSWKYVETGQNADGSPIYGGWGPLDETVDKVNATPGLRLLLDISYAPSWRLAIDRNGNHVGYGAVTAVLPDGPAMALFAAAVAQRYGNRIFIYQCGNEEYDTALNGAVGGTILGYTFNYFAPAVQQYAPQSLVIPGCVRPGAHPNGASTQQWMINFYTYPPKAGEPKQALPVAHDFHFYDDSAVIASTNYPAPDPTVTDNSANYLLATKVPIQGVVSIMQGVLNTYNPNCQIWNLENGYSLPNNSPNNHNNSPSDTPGQQSRYTRDTMAQLQQLGAGKYFFYSALDHGNDPRSLCTQAISDYTAHVAAMPQWVGVAAPTALLNTSVDALSFQGTPAQKPPDQYFSIENPGTGSVSWSLTSSQAWLSAVTVPTNGKNGNTGGNATSGTLLAGQNISLVCKADSTHNGLALSTPLTGTLTITINGTPYTITVSLFVTPTQANPDINSASAGPGNGPTFTMAVNASPPFSQGISFTNQDSYPTWWYAFSTGNWLSIDVSSGTLAAGANQTINISIASAASSLAPGSYTEVVTISATPFPAQYITSNTPAVTQFITVIVNLTVQVAHTPTIAVQLSTPTLLYSAAAGSTLPNAQTFYIHNCTNAAKAWTASVGSYTGGGPGGWLTLDHTSSSTNLPANGSNNGASVPQATDYFVITASINTTGLAAGTYGATITVTLGGSATQTITVTYTVTSSSPTEIIGVAPTSVNLTQAQGGAPVTTTVTLTNTGNTTGTWTHVNTYQVGSGWLTISPGTGALNGSGGTQVVTITCTPGPNRVPNTYMATVTFSLGTTTATLQVTFVITANSNPATIAVSPLSLNFSDLVGAANPAPQIVTLSNIGGQTGTWSAVITYADAQGWLTLPTSSGQLAPAGTQQLSVFVDDTGLAPGTHAATITFSMADSQVDLQVTFAITPQTATGAFTLLSVQKLQMVKIYSPAGQYLGVWPDAPHLVGLKQTMNAVDSLVKMTLPRPIDAFGGAGQTGTDNTLVEGNNVQIWLYGPGLPSGGYLKFNGFIDTVEPTITEKNDESVTVTLIPYGAALADHGYPGSFVMSSVDPLNLFTFWFNNVDPTPGLGSVPYANPLTLDGSNPATSGLGLVTYTIQNQVIKSVFDAAMLMLGPQWFWRVNPDTTTTFNQLAATAQHTLTLGQHMASLSYASDNSQRKNVVVFQGKTGISWTAVGASALPPSQGGIGERVMYKQDSRVTDVATAQIIANGLLAFYDRPLVRTKCRLVDFRGDTKSALGYDIESILVGDTVTIKDGRTRVTQTTWGNFRYGQGQWGQTSGAPFNVVSPVVAITYNYNTVDLEIGTWQPSQDRALWQIQQKFQDFTVGQ